MIVENCRLIIGYGNPLRSDDGVGQVVAQTIESRRDAESCVSSIACHQLLPEHAELISQAAHVIFVDAEAGSEAGRITVRELAPGESGEAAAAGLIHDFTPGALLAYARQLYGRAPRATLVTIGGYSFAYGDELSEPMRARLPALLERIEALLSLH